MASADLASVLDYLRTALAPAHAAGLTDAQLLARFAAGRDESAFAVLVARHGAMVLNVCRRLLRHEQDAEDAFQATFLVLARKAGSVRWADTAAPWLFEVATRTALEARALVCRRRAREQQVEELPQPAVPPPEAEDWRALLTEEVRRLPARYRSAVVLCELQGRTRREAARELGVPEGTLSSRLAAAKQMLAQRLARRGLAPSALVAGTLFECPPSGVSLALVGSTVKNASLIAVGLAAEVPAPAAALMKGVLETMFLTRLKLVVAALMIVAALGTGGFAYQAGQPAPAKAGAAAKPASELEALRKENELLKLNLQVVLEKVRAQEDRIRALETQAKGLRGVRDSVLYYDLRSRAQYDRDHRRAARKEVVPSDPVKEVEAALKAVKEARDNEAKRRAALALEKAANKLQDQLKGSGSSK
jgi:RNA polymerase sigma factor (sigma-70 family)